MAAESRSSVFLPRPLPTLLSLLFVLLLLVAPSIQSPPPKKMSKPTIVLVPGAWHQPAHYSALIGMLESASYEVVTKRLPSVDSSTPTQQSVPNDATFIEKHLLCPLVDQGKDVLLLMHSYGGCPGADAAKGYSKKERTVAGKKGGIIGLVFMAAFLANEGDSLLSKLPNQEYDPWVVWNVSTYAHLPSAALLGETPADALTPSTEGNLAAQRVRPQERLLQRRQ
jgi:pimeloyl-ACP methyl ester carboxylesterase